MSSLSRSEIDEAAARWVVRMHSDQITREDETAFTAWLHANGEHRRAYERQNALWSDVGSLRHDPIAMAELAGLREAAPRQRGVSRRGLLAASLTGGVVVAGGGSWVAWNRFFREQRVETAVGEQRRVILADGSAVTLNTNSLLRHRFDARERRLWLDRGQAFFAVAHDADRPFRVFVGDDEVRAVGTAFDVRRDGARACVTLEEGVVAVYRDAQVELMRAVDEPPPTAVLEAGQQLVVAPAQQIQIAMVDTRRTGAWRFGQMVLESEALSGAVAEINRYNARQIIIADPSLNDMAVNGVFQTGRPEAFVEALTAAFPVEIWAEDDRAIYLERRRLD